METLEPSPNEFVVRDVGGIRLVRTETTQAREGWRAAAEALDADATVFPVLRDRDGVAHYPTGEVTVRFDVAPTDAALRAFAKAQRVTLARRNALEARQVVFAPARGVREWLPDLVERLAAVRGVARAWPNTVSHYRKA